MSDDRANRLREKRGRAKKKARGESDETDEPSETSETSVKDEQVGRYLYLPEEQNRRIDQVYNKLKADYEFEYDETLEKNRHYYPLLVRKGLESLESFDASDVKERLDELDV